jgi:hypothetical protein
MSLIETVVEGTLQPDGTLLLDAKPNLLPGRVTVMLRQKAETPPPQEDWWQHLQRIRAEREASGYPFMNDEEVQAHIDWLREGDYIDELLKHADERRDPAQS